MGTFGVLLAQVSNPAEVSTVAGSVAVIVAAAAIVGQLALRGSTAPRRVVAHGATMELRDETPALVDLLTGGFEVDDDAVPATVVDLAQRGWFTIEDVGGRVVIRTRRRRPADDATTPYEARVLRHIEGHAIDGVVPTEVLTIGPDGVSERWFKGFVREVTKHGRSLGLCRRRWDLRHLAIAWLLAGVAFVPAMVISSTANRTSDPTGWGSLGNLLVGAAFVIAFVAGWVAGKISRSDAQADTADGRLAAEHWLAVGNHYRTSGDFADKPAASVAIWDRHLAYATAMGLARRVQREIPFETEHDRRAWSRATGEWRLVKVRYQAFRPNWGVHPGRVLFEGLIQGAVSAVITVVGYRVARDDSILADLPDTTRRWIGLGGLMMGIAALVVFTFCLAKVVLSVPDLFRRRTVEGDIVRRRVYRTGHRLPKLLQWLAWSGRDQQGMRRDQRRDAKHHLAIDDGSDESVVAYVVKREIYGQVSQGAKVRVRVSPLLGYVSSIEVLAPAPRSAVSEPAVPHALVEDTVGRVGTKAAGRFGDALAQAETMTDENGRPLLDQVDGDGVTMRQRLEQSQGQLDQLRNDPRLANSPIGGLLDSLLGGIVDPDSVDDGGAPPQTDSPDDR